MLIAADLKCYCCGSIAGEVFTDTTHPHRFLAYLPAEEPLANGRPPRHCQRCGGPIFLDEAQTVTRHEVVRRLRQRPASVERAAVGA
jgi:hypothetical protein